jgi:hypothetical protein
VTARDALQRAQAAGILVFLRPDGAVQARPTPAQDLLQSLRAHRTGIAALLATATCSPDLPACPSCDGQHFWRGLDMRHGAVGDWTCIRVPIPPGVMRVDILGPVRGKAMIVVSAFREEASDADTFSRLLVEWGAEIIVAMPDPENPRSRGTKVQGCR